MTALTLQDIHHDFSGLQVLTGIDLEVREGERHAVIGPNGAGRQHLPLVQEFRPDLLVWYFGFNSHREEYASLGLTEADYLAACDLLVSLANAMERPLQVVLGGGSLHQVAAATIPGIIQRLAED